MIFMTLALFFIYPTNLDMMQFLEALFKPKKCLIKYLIQTFIFFSIFTYVHTKSGQYPPPSCLSLWINFFPSSFDFFILWHTPLYILSVYTYIRQSQDYVLPVHIAFQFKFKLCQEFWFLKDFNADDVSRLYHIKLFFFNSLSWKTYFYILQLYVYPCHVYDISLLFLQN